MKLKELSARLNKLEFDHPESGEFDVNYYGESLLDVLITFVDKEVVLL